MNINRRIIEEIPNPEYKDISFVRITNINNIENIDNKNENLIEKENEFIPIINNSINDIPNINNSDSDKNIRQEEKSFNIVFFYEGYPHPIKV